MSTPPDVANSTRSRPVRNEVSREEFLDAIQREAAKHSNLTWKQFHAATRFHVRILETLRLGKWNDAKRAAGLARTPSGKPKKWSDAQVAAALRAMQAVLGRALIEQDFEAGALAHQGFSLRVVNDRFTSLARAKHSLGLLEGRRRSVPDDVLLAELKELAVILGRTPAQDELTGFGLMSPPTYLTRFGSWEAVLEKVGLPPLRREAPSREVLLAHVGSLHQRLGRVPTTADLEHGEWGAWHYVGMFGGWNAAIIEAGLEPTKKHSIVCADLVVALQALGQRLGRVPSMEDMDVGGGFSSSTYVARFKSWSEAIAAAGFERTPQNQLDEESVSRKLLEWEAESLEPLTILEVARRGVTIKTLVRLYGSWGRARRKLGLRIGRQYSVTTSDLLSDLREVAAGSKDGFTQDEYRLRGGRFDPCTYIRHFEGWNAALLAAGLKPRRRMDVTMAELIAEICRVRDVLRAQGSDRTPFVDDMESFSSYSINIFYARFGTWGGAVRAAGLRPNKDWAHPSEGRDGDFYDSIAERRVADVLFEMRINGEIADYEAHVPLGVEIDRRWTVDFAVETVDGRAVLIEYDGMGPHRPVPYSSPENHKMRFLRQESRELIVVTSFAPPSWGRRVTERGLRAALLEAAT